MVLAVPLAEWIIPVAIMLLLYAVSFLLVKPLTWALQQIPVIGGAAAAPVASMGATVVGWAKGWLDSAAGGMLSVAQAVIGNAYNFLGSVVQGIEWVVASLASLTVLVVETPARILGAQQAAEAYAAQLAAQMVTTAAHDLATAELKAASLVTGAAATAAAYTDAKVAQAVSIAEHAAAVALSSAEADVVQAETAAATAVRSLETTWAPQIRTLQGDVGTLTGDLSQLLPLALPLVIPGLLTAVKALEKDVVDCCGTPSTPPTGGLGSLLTAAELALVFGLVGGAIADPRDTARAVQAGAGGLVSLGKGAAGIVGLSL